MIRQITLSWVGARFVSGHDFSRAEGKCGTGEALAPVRREQGLKPASKTRSGGTAEAVP